VPHSEPLAEREPHIFEVAASAMDENDRRCTRPCPAQFDDVLA
jgi:hypothetical protein